MQIIKTNNYEEMSRVAAEKIINLVKKKPHAELGLATGGTPEGVYRLLIEDHQANGTSYKQVRTVNLDEYIGLPKEDQNSYFTFMKEKLFNHIDILPENTHVPNGMAGDVNAEADRYESFVHEIGGVDLQILGIGHNGHIAFNEPGTPFDSTTHVIDLTEDTRQANARFFNSIDEVPTKAITMGIQTIMDSKEIILLASGASKAEALKRLVHGEITEQFPASILQKHSHVTIIADEAALQLI
ncbi:glucosamine-6-phosphate deaminase [Bacillus sp. AGMB 02131]|uniref:Glucosamine-6-phosphate deaminase n=1 Tax=Peribacillus faecalis TaxID=2772559 RepID=A0A927CZP6_9BACI|nr:glucosamine-6-phosphate deaminase [Peribacillus faecalis]MBD3108750.1 glucosamine-6-phosphate deaminase [Peribacillus faecalis]